MCRLPGNDVDDDCDGTKDNPLMACDAGLASNSGNAMDYAKAIDLCSTTTESSANKKDKKWGVISANLFLASGAGTPAANSRSIRAGFGTNIVPLGGSRIAVLSTGHAADSNDTNPSLALTTTSSSPCLTPRSSRGWASRPTRPTRTSPSTAPRTGTSRSA